MNKRNIIVVGASMGGFEAFKKIVAGLPSLIDASIFIVWHISPDIRGVLPHVLNNQNSIYAANAADNEIIRPNRIYVAPPDHHMLIEGDRLRVTRGPKENRFRPAVDPLFRSAAQSYGNRVIGVILTGALDDGTSGLWSIKDHGGIAIAQDPMDAEVSSMPENAIREVAVDYVVPLKEMAALLVKLAAEEVSENGTVMADNTQLATEIKIAEEENAFQKGIMEMGELTPFSCPECHGVLTRLRDGNRERYRCHTGHAFSADSLLAALTEKIEDSLYSAIRGVEESVMLMNHVGDHFAEANHPKLAGMYFQKAKEAMERVKLVREAVMTHEQLSVDSLRYEEETKTE